MNISTDFKQINPDFVQPDGGYEWWYFDGLSKDGQNGFVIIFYYNNPFSTRYIEDLKKNSTAEKYPAISISVYKNGRTLYYSFLEFDEHEFEWDSDEQRLQVQNNGVEYKTSEAGEIEFTIRLNQQIASSHRIKGEIKGKGVLASPDLIQSESEDRHFWNLLLPSIPFDAHLDVVGKDGEEELKFSGFCYHDHNTGREPMKESFRDWYWGRYHFDSFTLVYYLMNKHNDRQFEAWLIGKENQEVLEHFDHADLDYFTRNWFGLNSARKLELKKGEVTVNIQCSNKIDDGPFYQRFVGESVIRYNDEVHAAHGISEFIYPVNIYKKLYWPLVHMRLRYMMREPHWVQKSALMYPWTW